MATVKWLGNDKLPALGSIAIVQLGDTEHTEFEIDAEVEAASVEAALALYARGDFANVDFSVLKVTDGVPEVVPATDGSGDGASLTTGSSNVSEIEYPPPPSVDIPLIVVACDPSLIGVDEIEDAEDSPLPEATEGTPYSVFLAPIAKGDASSIAPVFTVAEGTTLPDGLSLTQSEITQKWSLAGTPTTPGDYTFGIHVADTGLHNGTGYFSLHIEAAA